MGARELVNINTNSDSGKNTLWIAVCKTARISYHYGMSNPLLDKIREDKRKVKEEVRSRTVTALTTALGLVAGLAWNNAINALITQFFPSPGKNIPALFLYAFLLTIAVAVLAYYMNRLFSPASDGEQ